MSSGEVKCPFHCFSMQRNYDANRVVEQGYMLIKAATISLELKCLKEVIPEWYPFILQLMWCQWRKEEGDLLNVFNALATVYANKVIKTKRCSPTIFCQKIINYLRHSWRKRCPVNSVCRVLRLTKPIHGTNSNGWAFSYWFDCIHPGLFICLVLAKWQLQSRWYISILKKKRIRCIKLSTHIWPWEHWVFHLFLCLTIHEHSQVRRKSLAMDITLYPKQHFLISVLNFWSPISGNSINCIS